MGATLTTVLPMLREHVRDSITDIWFEADKTITPFMASMESKSMDDGMGRGYVIPVQYGMGSSVSSTFATAQGISQGSAAGNAAARDRWIVQASTINATAQWTRDAILGAKGADELFDVMQKEMDAKIARIRQRVSHYGWEAGYGRVGTLSAITTSQITFASASVMNRLEVGDWLNASATIDGALRYATDAQITTIDPDTGICATAVDVSGGSYAWGATDIIFFGGDHTQSTLTQPVGMRGWVPPSAPSGSFMNITRTGIPALTGLRLDCTSLDHATALIRGGQKLFKFGSKPNVAFLSAEDYGTLTCDKKSVKLVGMTLGKYEIGFDAFPLNSPAGMIKVLPDAMMEQGNYWMGPFDDKNFAPFLIHNDDLVNVDNIDGLDVARLAASTAFEMRLYFRGAIAVPAPGKFLCGSSLPTS